MLQQGIDFISVLTTTIYVLGGQDRGGQRRRRGKGSRIAINKQSDVIIHREREWGVLYGDEKEEPGMGMGNGVGKCEFECE